MWTLDDVDGVVMAARVPVRPATVLAPESPWSDLERRLGPPLSRRFLIDLADERFLTSEALAVLVGLVRRVHEAGGRLVFVTRQPAVLSVLESTRLARLVPVAADRASGLASLAAP